MNPHDKNTLAESAKKHQYSAEDVEKLLTLFDKRELKKTARHMLRLTDAQLAAVNYLQGSDLESLSYVNNLALQLIDL